MLSIFNYGFLKVTIMVVAGQGGRIINFLIGQKAKLFGRHSPRDAFILVTPREMFIRNSCFFASLTDHSFFSWTILQLYVLQSKGLSFFTKTKEDQVGKTGNGATALPSPHIGRAGNECQRGSSATFFRTFHSVLQLCRSPILSLGRLCLTWINH